MALQQHRDRDELQYHGRGKLQVFQVLNIVEVGGVSVGMVAQIFRGDKVFLEASPRFWAYKAKRHFGPAGTQGASKDEVQEWKKGFFHSLLWPSPQQHHDIRVGVDWVYAELLDRNSTKMVEGHGDLPFLEINDLFKVFSRGERIKPQRNQEAEPQRDAPDQLVLGYSRILRNPKNNHQVFVEMVSDPLQFKKYKDLETYLIRNIGMDNFNGFAMNLRVVGPDGKTQLTANYFPIRMENHAVVVGTTTEEVQADLQTLQDKGIPVGDIHVFETTRAFLDTTMWDAKQGKALQEFQGTMFHVYGHHPSEKPVDIQVMEWWSPGGGKSKKKGPPSWMVRSMLSRTMILDKKDQNLPPRPGKVRVLTPIGGGDLLSSLSVYMTPEQRAMMEINTPAATAMPAIPMNTPVHGTLDDDMDDMEIHQR